MRHQLRFLELQRDLILEFHQDLAHNGERLAQGDPLVPQFCAYLNASSYIAAVLREWGEMKVIIIIIAVGYYTPALSIYYYDQPVLSVARNDSNFTECTVYSCLSLQNEHF